MNKDMFHNFVWILNLDKRYLLNPITNDSCTVIPYLLCIVVQHLGHKVGEGEFWEFHSVSEKSQHLVFLFTVTVGRKTEEVVLALVSTNRRRVVAILYGI